MYEEQESIYYYLTVGNEPYVMPPMPNEDVKEGVLKGMYKYKGTDLKDTNLHAQLMGSGSILNEVLKAGQILEERYNVAADVWSVTSYKQLYRDGDAVDRWNMLHPSEPTRVPYVTACFENALGVFVAASDYVQALPDSISQWIPRPLVTLGTDGYGRSDDRTALRDFFEVDARFITLATLNALAREDRISFDVVQTAMQELDIDPKKPNPMAV